MNNLDQLEALENDVDEELQPLDSTIKKEQKKKEEEIIDELVRQSFSPKVRPMEKKPYKIGICGGHSSGKALLREKLSDELTLQGFKGYVITQDQFDVDIKEDQVVSEQSRETQCEAIPFINYKNYQKFLANAHETLDLLIDVNVIIVEGTLIFHDKTLRDKFDLKIFLQGDRDVRLSRKSLQNIVTIVFKDVCHNGKDLEKVIAQYLYLLKPLYEKIIKPTEQYADMVIPRFGGGFNLNQATQNSVGFEYISNKILQLLVKIVKANIISNQQQQSKQT